MMSITDWNLSKGIFIFCIVEENFIMIVVMQHNILNLRKLPGTEQQVCDQ